MAMKVMTSQTCIASPVISQIILPGMRQEEVRNWVDGRFRGFGQWLSEPWVALQFSSRRAIRISNANIFLHSRHI